jgi:hypothetical protein
MPGANALRLKPCKGETTPLLPGLLHPLTNEIYRYVAPDTSRREHRKDDGEDENGRERNDKGETTPLLPAH